MNDTVLYDVDGGIATVTLNRPDRMNTMNQALLDGALEAMQRAADDDQVLAVILTGNGRAFCAGGDLEAMAAGDVPGLEGGGAVNARIALLRHAMRTSQLLRDMPKVTIAAINGACAGAGLGFACACDLRIAARSAVFRSAFLGVGVAGDMGVPWLLSRLVGEAAAKQISFLDDKFGPEQALRYGLIQSVHDDGEFPAAVSDLARRMAAKPPLAMRAMKRHYLAAANVDFPTFTDLEFQRHYHLLATADAREGFAAFGERRAPRFTGE